MSPVYIRGPRSGDTRYVCSPPPPHVYAKRNKSLYSRRGLTRSKPGAPLLSQASRGLPSSIAPSPHLDRIDALALEPGAPMELASVVGASTMPGTGGVGCICGERCGVGRAWGLTPRSMAALEGGTPGDGRVGRFVATVKDRIDPEMWEVQQTTASNWIVEGHN